MRLPSALAAGLPTVAALVLLSACSSDPAEPRPSSAPPASSSAAATSSSGDDVTAFCSQAGSVFTELSTAFAGASNPTQLPPLLDQAATALRSVDPPAEIQKSWDALSGAVTEMAQSARSVDLATPQGLDQFMQRYDALTADTTAAQQDVDSYVKAHCPAAGAPSS